MRYFVELSYKGKNYHGWQIQPNAISVQEKVNNAFSKILNKNVLCVAAGRTDKGVHALQMFVHIDFFKDIDNKKYIYKFNSVLPDDIIIKNIFKVREDAHARFNAISRSYVYKIFMGRDPFLLDTTWQIYNKNLDILKMNEASKLVLNYTNFKCFSKSKTNVKTYNCKISSAKWKIENNLLTFKITADRFLRNMVRAIVGNLVEIGIGKRSISDFIKIIESENRITTITSAPAQGLSLDSITYPETIRI